MPKTFCDGLRLFRSGDVSNGRLINDKSIEFTCHSAYKRNEHYIIRIDSVELGFFEFELSCTCPATFQPRMFCKHKVASLFAMWVVKKDPAIPPRWAKPPKSKFTLKNSFSEKVIGGLVTWDAIKERLRTNTAKHFTGSKFVHPIIHREQQRKRHRAGKRKLSVAKM